MEFSNWLAFCSVGFLAAATPGPGVLLAISNSVEHGPRRALVSSLGNVLGLFIMSASVMAGLGVLLATSATAFMALKILGAGYLIYLGIKQWRSQGHALSMQKSASPHFSERQLLTQGLSVALTNPKALLFFSALFPQFLTQQAPLLRQFLVLTTTFASCVFLTHVFYVLLAHSLKNQFSSTRLSHVFNRVTGAIFIVLGLGLLRLRNQNA